MESKLILKYCNNCKENFLGSKKQIYCKRELCIKKRNCIKSQKYKISEKGKKYIKDNSKKTKKQNELWRKENPNYSSEKSKQWRLKNPNALREWRKENPNYNTEWRLNNLERARETSQKFATKERATNPQYKIKQNVARRIRELLGGEGKGAPTETLLGCTIKQFKLHLEKQFIKRYGDEFNWDEYNHKNFHIDHIRPCASFNLTNKKELLECFNYKNQELLTARENMVKGDKHTQPL